MRQNTMMKLPLLIFRKFVKYINCDKNEIYDEGEQAEFPDDNSADEIEEGVSNIKYDKNEKNNEGKDAEFSDDISFIEMEEGVKDKNDDKNEIYDEGKE